VECALRIVILITYIYFKIITIKKMQEGTVKFYNEEKGFGFITPKNGGSEIFVHATGLSESIRENDEVRYDIAEGKKGPNAVNVVVA
jgi:CspA family cold shock protein